MRTRMSSQWYFLANPRLLQNYSALLVDDIPCVFLIVQASWLIYYYYWCLFNIILVEVVFYFVTGLAAMPHHWHIPYARENSPPESWCCVLGQHCTAACMPEQCNSDNKWRHCSRPPSAGVLPWWLTRVVVLMYRYWSYSDQQTTYYHFHVLYRDLYSFRKFHTIFK